MSSRQPKPISDILDDFLKNRTQNNRRSPWHVEDAWKASVGKKISKHTAPISFNNKRLVVNVDSSMWLYQLGFLKEGILSKLKSALGENDIEDIYFKIGKV